MQSPDFTQRRLRLQTALRNQPLDALLVSGLANVRYLTGFTGDSSWLLVTQDRVVMLSDTRYRTQLEAECPELPLEIRDASSTVLELSVRVVTGLGLSHLGLEGDHLSQTQFVQLRDKLAGVSTTAVSSMVEALREIKDEWELKQIRRAVRCAERAFRVVRSSLRPNQTETELRFLLESAMRDFGGSETAFTPIVGVGPTSALPHARAGARRVDESPVLLIDWGAALESGYRCDLTRVVFTSEPTEEMRRVYDVVLGAQQAAISAIRPGASCKAVDEIARGFIERSGYGAFFGHGLGHGFGLEIHEAVQMRPSSTQSFVPGMVVTVEPGIYLPGRFGVRLEDDVLVTESGCEVLSSLPREFDAACVNILA